MFIEVYRCKMCGKEIKKEIVDEVKADIELVEEHSHERHFCDNGDFGVVEFIGMRKE